MFFEGRNLVLDILLLIYEGILTPTSTGDDASVENCVPARVAKINRTGAAEVMVLASLQELIDRSLAPR